ncbi:HD domain-containing protein [Desulforegula conservatrix]|uniref:hypothetical protein n=1 Tax=Desulforegula conservatrix TaxID=153026 RepID=UPI0003F72DA8|nr:hypothetical protein [Desulforegula conservatrix]
MDEIYKKIRDRARQIALELPSPEFYTKCAESVEISDNFFETDPLIREIYRDVAIRIENDFGHGLAHAEAVARDAGALLVEESRILGDSNEITMRRLLVVQTASLLHDVQRKMADHAIEGAITAGEILPAFPFELAEIDDICQAIRNHEAFREISGFFTSEGQLVSDCLYDADKFRWGPDNFKYTVWDMIAFANIPFPRFMVGYQGGMKALQRIKTSFRSTTGKKYGPQFIDMGVFIGEKLYSIIQEEYSGYLGNKAV